MAHGALTPIIGLRLLALAAGLRHNAEIGQPGLCFSAYGHKFGINHLAPRLAHRHPSGLSRRRWANLESSPGWTRTNNPPVNSRMLCQLSYRGTVLSGRNCSRGMKQQAPRRDAPRLLPRARDRALELDFEVR